MTLVFRRIRFFLRWVVFYNLELIWLNLRLPRKIPPVTGLDRRADERRRRAHSELSAVAARLSEFCSACKGHCCLKDMDRFTAFDQIVRQETDAPPPSWDGRIYSIRWLALDTLRQTIRRLTRPRSHRQDMPICKLQSGSGCSLAWPERPMICVSWFCPRAVFAMDCDVLAMAEGPIREIEHLHREALGAARAANGN